MAAATGCTANATGKFQGEITPHHSEGGLAAPRPVFRPDGSIGVGGGGASSSGPGLRRRPMMSWTLVAIFARQGGGAGVGRRSRDGQRRPTSSAELSSATQQTVEALPADIA